MVRASPEGLTLALWGETPRRAADTIVVYGPVESAGSGDAAISRLYPDYVPPHHGHPTLDAFEVVERPRLGRAVLARQAFRAGAWMARFDGITVGYLTQHSLQKSARLHLVDLHFAGLLAHACAPNAVLDMARQNLHALTDIAPGDLLTIDYEATEDELFAPFHCGCGAELCRGAIVGRSLRPQA